LLNCPKCSRILIDSTTDGGYKLRTRMVLFNANGVAEALCPTCKTKVVVPLIIGDLGVVPPKTKHFIQNA
jgi:hypothetical protein